jgi:putative alpha-1,2-mannosidase
MGALAVLMKMGIFQMRGGAAIHPVVDIGSPIFDKITIHLNRDYFPGEKFVIETIDNSEENLYIQSATLDGQKLDKCWFYHEELVDGGKLILNMGDKPNKSWGSDPDLLPPSMTDERW